MIGFGEFFGEFGALTPAQRQEQAAARRAAAAAQQQARQQARQQQQQQRVQQRQATQAANREKQQQQQQVRQAVQQQRVQQRQATQAASKQQQQERRTQAQQNRLQAQQQRQAQQQQKRQEAEQKRQQALAQRQQQQQQRKQAEQQRQAAARQKAEEKRKAAEAARQAQIAAQQQRRATALPPPSAVGRPAESDSSFEPIGPGGMNPEVTDAPADEPMQQDSFPAEELPPEELPAEEQFSEEPMEPLESELPADEGEVPMDDFSVEEPMETESLEGLGGLSGRWSNRLRAPRSGKRKKFVMIPDQRVGYQVYIPSDGMGDLGRSPRPANAAAIERKRKAQERREQQKRLAAARKAKQIQLKNERKAAATEKKRARIEARMKKKLGNKTLSIKSSENAAVSTIVSQRDKLRQRIAAAKAELAKRKAARLAAQAGRKQQFKKVPGIIPSNPASHAGIKLSGLAGLADEFDPYMTVGPGVDPNVYTDVPAVAVDPSPSAPLTPAAPAMTIPPPKGFEKRQASGRLNAKDMNYLMMKLSMETQQQMREIFNEILALNRELMSLLAQIAAESKQPIYTDPYGDPYGVPPADPWGFNPVPQAPVAYTGGQVYAEPVSHGGGQTEFVQSGGYETPVAMIDSFSADSGPAQSGGGVVYDKGPIIEVGGEEEAVEDFSPDEGEFTDSEPVNTEESEEMEEFAGSLDEDGI